MTEVHRFANVPVQAGGTLHWDVLRSLRGRARRSSGGGRETRLDSVAVDSWAVDFGLLDAKGRLCGNPVHYRDPRRAARRARVHRVPPRELYERTGIQLIPINTVFELAAMADDGDPRSSRRTRSC